MGAKLWILSKQKRGDFTLFENTDKQNKFRFYSAGQRQKPPLEGVEELRGKQTHCEFSQTLTQAWNPSSISQHDLHFLRILLFIMSINSLTNHMRRMPQNLPGKHHIFKFYSVSK